MTHDKKLTCEQLKDEFLGNVSHEFKSPLSSVKGYLDLLHMQRKELSPRHQEYIAMMRHGVERLGRFIDDVLDLTVLQSGLMQFSCEPVDVKQLLEQIAASTQRSTKEHHFTITVQCPPSLCAWADAERFCQIVRHLLSNAVKFTPDGGKITLWAKEQNPTTVQLGVTDTGIGIPRDKWTTIFNKFEQIMDDKHKVRKTTGTGLGLTLVKGLVQAQGGEVEIEASSSKGTTVVWTLPTPKRMSLAGTSASSRDHVRHAA